MNGGKPIIGKSIQLSGHPVPNRLPNATLERRIRPESTPRCQPGFIIHSLHANVSRISSRTLLGDERLKNPHAQYLLVSPASEIPGKITSGPNRSCYSVCTPSSPSSRMVQCHQPKPLALPGQTLWADLLDPRSHGTHVSINNEQNADGPHGRCHQPKPRQISNRPQASLLKSTRLHTSRTDPRPVNRSLGGRRRTDSVTSRSPGHSVVQCLQSTCRIRSASNTTRAKGQFWLHGIKPPDRPRASNQFADCSIVLKVGCQSVARYHPELD